MKTTREYDYNIWSDGNSLFLTAYELMVDITGQADYLILNPSRYATIGWVINDHSSKGMIQYLLSIDGFMANTWEQWDFTDYDDWTHLGALENGENMPMEIRQWLDSLPEYEVANG